jgi:5-methylcytosine-specific restriction endonuclease McrA
MDYYFYNNDAKSFHGRRRTNVLIDEGVAITGGPRSFGGQLAQLSPLDTLLMYEDGVGIVAVGNVREKWDRKSYRTPIYYVLGESLLKPEREYRIGVNWFLDLRATPISLQEVKKRLGYQPRGAVKKIVKRRSEIERIIAKHKSSRVSSLPEEVVESAERIPEGAKRTITVNAYERNPVAREKCIRHWGLECQVCGVLLQSVYGHLATGYIHVHHLIPLSQLGAGYAVDPIKDMRPVCPNCHAVLHRKDPPQLIEDLRNQIQMEANNGLNRTVAPRGRGVTSG